MDLRGIEFALVRKGLAAFDRPVLAGDFQDNAAVGDEERIARGWKRGVVDRDYFGIVVHFVTRGEAKGLFIGEVADVDFRMAFPFGERHYFERFGAGGAGGVWPAGFVMFGPGFDVRAEEVAIDNGVVGKAFGAFEGELTLDFDRIEIRRRFDHEGQIEESGFDFARLLRGAQRDAFNPVEER